MPGHCIPRGTDLATRVEVRWQQARVDLCLRLREVKVLKKSRRVGSTFDLLSPDELGKIAARLSLQVYATLFVF